MSDRTLTAEKHSDLRSDAIESILNSEKKQGDLPRLNGPEYTGVLDFSHINEKTVLRKIDLHLLPVLTTLYLFCFLDRGNIGNAKIEGLLEELHMTGPQYNWCLTIFFFPYCTFEIPSNVILRRLRPSIWLPTIMVGWGTVMTFMGLVTNYHGLLIARFFLGLTEAGFYPGIAFCITMWYCRHEAQFRQALFISAASIAGAFSGLLAYAIENMNGVGGYSGWRWIFILEGILTVVVALISYFFVHDFPDTASFLTEEERAWVMYRLRSQDSGKEHKATEVQAFKWKYIKDVFTDWQIYLASFIYLSLDCPLYGISYFLPSIINNLGYAASTAQLLTVPIYITAAMIAMGAAWVADRSGQRSPYIIFFMSCTVAGYLICLVTSGRGIPGVVYFGAFLVAIGVYPAIPANVTWSSSNLAGSYKRAAGMAFEISVGNIGGAMAANFYRSQDAPAYRMGHSLELGFSCAGLIAVIFLRGLYQRVNKKRGAEESSICLYTTEELVDMGDKSPTFRYSL